MRLITPITYSFNFAQDRFTPLNFLCLSINLPIKLLDNYGADTDATSFTTRGFQPL